MTDVRDPHDLYETPANAVRMLVENAWRAGTNIGKTWDPSCGRGAIVKAMLEQDRVRCGNPTSYHSQEVVGWDLHRYETLPGINRHHIYYGVDFGSVVDGQVPAGVRTIIMNPPYKLADEHVRHALHLIPDNGMVYALLRWNWITAIKRRDLLPHLSKIIICGRLKMLPPDVEDKGHSGTVDFAWFCFFKSWVMRIAGQHDEFMPVSCPDIIRAV